jgi:uncharacterized RDD family membrane protein YckC
MKEVFELIGTVVVAIVLVGAIGLLLSWPVMLLWNGCLVGAIAGANTIGWLQAWGLFTLFGMLFKNATVSNKGN